MSADEGGERVMASCKDCVHVEVCKDYIKTVLDDFDDSQMCGDDCEFFRDRSRFVELPYPVKPRDKDELLDEDGRPLTLGRVLGSIQSAARYNGLDEIITSWAKLKDEDGIIGHPDYDNPDYYEWVRNQLQVYWMICVLMFGDYGTSPRFGWITKEAAASFRKFCEEFSNDT